MLQPVKADDGADEAAAVSQVRQRGGRQQAGSPPPPPPPPSRPPATTTPPSLRQPPPLPHNVMGNGASATQLVIDGEHFDLLRLKQLLPGLKQQLKDRDTQLDYVRQELQEATELIRQKESTISRLKGEIHKLKSVLQATVHPDGKAEILATIPEHCGMVGAQDVSEIRNKKQGVSGESSQEASLHTSDLQHFHKDFR